ncbi:hypothetical protein [Rheinheimera sp.]|uniref:hypothetical protein n=1 Tax=Rheinheimera sp. TaxID=1869214 RepID=UPI00307E54D9
MAALAAIFFSSLYGVHSEFKPRREVGDMLVPHKAYQLKLEQRVLWVKAIGVSTVLQTEEYIKAFRETVQPVLHEPWAVVLDMSLWQPSPAQSFALLQDNSVWALAHNLKHVEILLPADPILTWQYLKATDTDKPLDLTRHLASDEQDARQSLIQAGFIRL